ncbi:ABC transporter ATP-binding protein [Aliidongia dinghuensis]|uniref:ABC transporter ATP-binding protein n=1 Tax=Aliidongia dinghuensis TaxID=1867774 RepID=A0A8J2Z1E4_9PROT|nr:ABC transporter ATP-binding protein [Aliidongia dinghuensis]GGF44428.1 ABC transporter ATP-binding protein [Aliidongia dinghuensis]
MASEPVLAVEDLSIALPPGGDRALAVEGVSLAIRPGEALCVVGESGSGKSMIANAVMGLLPRPHVRPTAGRILFEGRDLLDLSEAALRELRGRRIGMIFQEPMTALNPIMRIGDQIAEVYQSHMRIGRRECRERVLADLADVGLPDPARLIDSYPFRLSGGQRQRVMIAAALALEPALLIADEPTTALDVTTQAQILKLVRDLQRRRGMALLFITHDFGVVAEVADRVAVMQRGRLVEEGPARDVLDRPSHPYTRQLIAAIPHGRPAERCQAEAPVLLELDRLGKTYPLPKGRTFTALNDVSLMLRKGETLGIVGESGSGKSTIGRCVVGLTQPTSGRVLFEGVDISKLNARGMKPYRGRIQMVFQDPYASLNPRHRIGTAVTTGMVMQGVPRAKARERAAELLALVGLGAEALDRYPHEFSGGQRQRIGIARALAMEPDLLVADEPVSALDVSVQAQVLELFAEVRRKFDLGLLFITHDLRVAAQMCDRVAVMRAGELVEYGEAAEVLHRPRHAYTQALVAAVPKLEAEFA